MDPTLIITLSEFTHSSVNSLCTPTFTYSATLLDSSSLPAFITVPSTN